MARPRKHGKHLPPCVYERHGAYWYVKRGKWLRLAATLPDALAAYALIVSEPSDGMATLIDKVLAHISPKLKPTTRDQYRHAATHLKAALVEFAPHQVRSKHVAGIKVHMAETPNMANRCLSLLRQVFAQAVEWQLIDSNPAIGVKPYKESKRKRYISDEEYAKIYAKAGDRLKAIMDLLYFTGQRVVDVLSIRLSDLKEDGIEFEPAKTSGSTGTKLMVRWTPGLREAVERTRGLGGNVRAMTLLSGRQGKPPDYTTVKRQWSLACERAGVAEAQLRDLRAKSLTDAKRQGHDATALAGHASAAMTQRYIRRREVPIVDGPSFKMSKTLDSPN